MKIYTSKYEYIQVYLYLTVEKRPEVASASIAQDFVIFKREWYPGRKR